VRLIGNDWSGLEAGYHLMIAKDAELRRITTARLESAHQAHDAREQRAWDAGQQEREHRRLQAHVRVQALRRAGRIAVIVGIVLAIVALLLANETIGTIGVLALVGGLAALRVKAPPLCPEYQPRPISDATLLLNLDIAQRWWNGISDGMRNLGNDGDVGERLLIAHLRAALPDSYLCMRGVLVAPRLDADVIVIGPSGVWIFDSKYWNGSIIVRNGQWTRRKWYYEPGGYQAYRDDPITHRFDRQVDMEMEAVRRTIKRRVARIDADTLAIWTGVIFTHPDVTLDIDESWAKGYATVAQCVRWVTDAEENVAAHGGAEVDTERALAIFDALASHAWTLGDIPAQRAASGLTLFLAETIEREAASFASSYQGALPGAGGMNEAHLSAR